MTSVLVVDDDPDIQLLLRLELASEGYEVLTAADGGAAVELVARAHPDIVLLDVMMPDKDGWTVLAELEDPKPAVIMITGLGADRDESFRRAVELGAIGYVAKPFDSRKLLELVETASRLSADERVAFRTWLLAGGDEGTS